MSLVGIDEFEKKVSFSKRFALWAPFLGRRVSSGRVGLHFQPNCTDWSVTYLAMFLFRKRQNHFEMIREDVDGVDYGFDGNEVQQGVVGDCLSVSELKKKYSQCWEVSEKEKKKVDSSCIL